MGILRYDGRITKVSVFSCFSQVFQAAKEPEIASGSERLFALDQVHVIVFNDTHIFLPFAIEPVPGFDRIRVPIR